MHLGGTEQNGGGNVFQRMHDALLVSGDECVYIYY
jgi:hypothetical protein